MFDDQLWYDKIMSTLDANGMVEITSYTHCWEIWPDNKEAIALRDGRLCLRRGKHWDIFGGGCGIRLYRPAA